MSTNFHKRISDRRWYSCGSTRDIALHSVVENLRRQWYRERCFTTAMCLFAGATWKETQWEKSAVRNRASQNCDRFQIYVSHIENGKQRLDRRSICSAVVLSLSLSFSTDRFLYRWLDRINRYGKIHKYFAFRIFRRKKRSLE